MVVFIHRVQQRIRSFRMRRFLPLCLSPLFLPFAGAALIHFSPLAIAADTAKGIDRLASDPSASVCKPVRHDGTDYVVCHIDPAADLRLFLNDENDRPFGHFNTINDALAEEGTQLSFAMNAGMYHRDRSPVGHYIEGFVEHQSLNTNAGPGNFHLLPNGVFFIDKEGRADVLPAQVYQAQFLAADGSRQGVTAVAYATQSGPMLVIDGEIHPRFLPDSPSLKRRNGVGVTRGGEVIFVIADSPVRFYDFAAFFRDEVHTPNALFLDGTISRLYAPGLNRNDPGAAMGPVVGAVENSPQTNLP